MRPGSEPPGWAEPEGDDIQITRANATEPFVTEPLSHEPVWEDEGVAEEPDAEEEKPETGTHAAFSYDEAHGAEATAAAKPEARPAADPDGPGREAEEPSGRVS